jgi:hypothetical protein
VTAKKILEDAIATQSQRGKEYESSDKERSMADVVALFNHATKHSLTVSDGWLFMIFLKIIRGVKTSKEDSFVDLASYASWWGEERIGPSLINEKEPTDQDVVIPDGWTKWGGTSGWSGSESDIVDVMFRDGSTFYGITAASFWWQHINQLDDIIAFKVSTRHKPEELPKIPKGWTRWNGGRWKGEPNDFVNVLLKNGREPIGTIASYFRWEHTGKDDDIIAYRKGKRK